MSCPDCVCLYSSDKPELEEIFFCGKEHHSHIAMSRYKPELNSWENIATFDLGLRRDICFVAKDNFIYFIGGKVEETEKALTDVDRYNLNERKLDKLADLREARNGASGTAMHGKIFIAGGWSEMVRDVLETCEVYNEITNEWQSIARSSVICRSFFGNIMCVDDKVYVVGDCWDSKECRGEIECYDPDKDEWNVVTKLPVSDIFGLIFCSMRVFKGGNFVSAIKDIIRDDMT